MAKERNPEETFPCYDEAIYDLAIMLSENEKKKRATLTNPILDNEEFLLKVKQTYLVKRIYYPGCEYDDILEKVFDTSEIVYLDKDPMRQFGQGNGRNYIKGDYAHSPFRENSFDAVFIQDNHIEMPELRSVLKTLKPQGILIFSKFDCGGWSNLRPKQIKRIRTMQQLSLPFTHKNYSVFQKVAE